jgi:hypothetical protein
MANSASERLDEGVAGREVAILVPLGLCQQYVGPIVRGRVIPNHAPRNSLGLPIRGQGSKIACFFARSPDVAWHAADSGGFEFPVFF